VPGRPPLHHDLGARCLAQVAPARLVEISALSGRPTLVARDSGAAGGPHARRAALGRRKHRHSDPL